MAKASEMRKLVGKLIRFESDRTWMGPEVGVIDSVHRSESCINGDYHQTKSIKVIEIIKPTGEE